MSQAIVCRRRHQPKRLQSFRVNYSEGFIFWTCRKQKYPL
jgi:hypothetical protein